MPMPREEDDDDLFHSVDDVEFADDDADEKRKKKSPKKKTAKKTATKKVATKKTVKKKAAKKKAKRVSVSSDDDTPKPAPRKRRKKVAKAEKPAEASFGAGLFDSEEGASAEGQTEEKTEAAAEKPEKKAPARRKRSARKPAKADTPAPAVAETPSDEPQAEKPAEAAPNGDGKGKEKTDEYGRPEPVANYVVHVYEYGRLKRTLDRDFTPELAEAYATEFCRTSKRYGRQAVAGKKDTQPAKELEGEQDLLDRKGAAGTK